MSPHCPLSLAEKAGKGYTHTHTQRNTGLRDADSWRSCNNYPITRTTLLFHRHPLAKSLIRTVRRLHFRAVNLPFPVAGHPLFVSRERDREVQREKYI